MARQSQNGARPREILSSSVSEQNNINDIATAVRHDDEEQEYHTESEDSASIAGEQDALLADLEEDEDEDEDAVEFNPPAEKPTLLPADILNPLPSPVYSPQYPVSSIPRAQMSRKDKRAERNRSRRIKKAEWERVREEAKENGVLLAGRVAQLKRGVVGKGGEKVRSGRVKKGKKKDQVSGRQRLLDQRKKTVEERALGDGAKAVKRGKTRAVASR